MLTSGKIHHVPPVLEPDQRMRDKSNQGPPHMKQAWKLFVSLIEECKEEEEEINDNAFKRH